MTGGTLSSRVGKVKETASSKIEENKPTCSAHALATVLGLTPTYVLKTLQKKSLSVFKKIDKKSTTKKEAEKRKSQLADMENNHFHHLIVMYVLNDYGMKMERVSNKEYPTIHEDTEASYLVYGKLNFGFTPYKKIKRTNATIWSNQDCKINTFYGLMKNDDADNHDYHVVSVINGRLSCMNMKDNYEKKFTMASSACLSFKCVDGFVNGYPTYRYQIDSRKNKMNYLASVSKVHKIVEKKRNDKFVNPIKGIRIDINKAERKAINNRKKLVNQKKKHFI